LRDRAFPIEAPIAMWRAGKTKAGAIAPGDVSGFVFIM
jgi:hypothetical protein